MNSRSLTKLSAELLTEARSVPAGRAARTVHGGKDNRLRQTLIALAAGRGMAEHASPSEATLHVLAGRVRLVADALDWEGVPGDFISIPRRRHAVEAPEDSVILLTVITKQ